MVFMLQQAKLLHLLKKLKMPSGDLQVYYFPSLFCAFKPHWMIVTYLESVCNIEWEIQVSMAHSNQIAAQTNAVKRGK